MTDPSPPLPALSETTITDGQSTTSADREPDPGAGRPTVLAVSIMYHPEPERIGERLLVPWPTRYGSVCA